MFRLRIAYQHQTTEYSCWWASLRMLLEYHTGLLYAFPWDYHASFRPPPGRVGAIQYNAPPNQAALMMAEDEPWQWYYQGITPDLLNVNQLANIGGMRPMELTTGRSTFGGGSWLTARLDAAWMEDMLRQFGPVYIIRRRGTGHHAFVISGVLQRTGGPDGRGLIETQDPWPPLGRSRTMTMSTLQSQLAPQLRAFNMLVFRSARANPSVVEQDDTY
jgi:hypothetical protein